MFALGLIIGMIVGAALGVFVMASIAAGKREDERNGQ